MAEKSREGAKTLSDAATKALSLFEDSKTFHDGFCQKVESRYKSFRGILEIDSDAAQWTSKLHPPYINHIVETTISALVDDKLSYRVRPRPKMYDEAEWAAAREGAKAHELLHGYQLARDRFAEKQRPFALQNAIAGLTVAKNYWKNDVRPARRLDVVDVGLERHDVPGVLLDLQEVEGTKAHFVGPTTEVVNVYDFGWHESAVELQRSPVVWHRVWMHINELRLLQKKGVYTNVDQLGESRSFQSEYDDREDKSNRQRTKDMVEVLEIWYLAEDGIRTVTLGNRKVELRKDKKNPFWHGEYPFVVCSTQPDLFRVQGMSQVEKIAHLQEAAWDIMNQRLDNLRLLNNAIPIISSSLVDDPDSFEFGPGERWLVEGDAQQAVQMWTPNPVPAEISLPAEQMLKSDMQTLAASNPFTSTSEARGIGADTATEAALVTNIAQRSAMAQKQQLHYAYQRIGQQRTELNQQFLRRSVMVEHIGLDSQQEMKEIAPFLLQGEFDFDIQPMVESMMRSERRAEGNAKMQAFASVVFPIWLAASQANLVAPPNVEEWIRDWLESYEAEDVDRFFSKQPPPQQAPPAQGGGQPQPGGAPPGPGVTAPQATDPVSSPSSDLTVNPGAAAQQTAARVGGLNNL